MKLKLNLDLKIETEHFNYYFSENSIPNFEKIKKFNEFFGLKQAEYGIVVPRTDYFKLTSQESKEVFGKKQTGAFSNGYITSIQWDSAHEASHVIGSILGRPPRFIREGFAVMNAADHNNIIQNPTIENLTENEFVRLMSDEGFYSLPEQEVHAIAGTFMQMVKEQEGIEGIKRMMYQDMPNKKLITKFTYNLAQL